MSLLTNIFYLNINQIQPSQLYLSEKKIEQALNSLRNSGFENAQPLPVKQLNDDIIFTDGHTRAYILWLNGYKEIKVIWEDEDLDWKLYKRYVEWCKQAGIRTIADLKDRIIDHGSYQIKWIERCKKNGRLHIEVSKNDLFIFKTSKIV